MPPKNTRVSKSNNPKREDKKTKVKVPAAGTTSKQTKTKISKDKGTSKSSLKNEQLSTKDKAAVKIQSAVRMFLATINLEKLKKEKKDYNELIEKIQKEAWLEIVKQQQQQDEKQRLNEENERKQRAQQLKWMKTFLEDAFEGELENIKKILNEVEVNFQNTNSLDDENGEWKIKQLKMKMIECKDANGNSALSEASAGGNIETITFLLDNGAAINSLGLYHRTPLYRAAFGGHLDAVKLLLAEGGDPRILDNDAVSAEQVAAFPEISNYLHEWNVDDTELILSRRAVKEEELQHEQMKYYEKQQRRLELNIQELEASYLAKQKMLQKAYKELNKRIYEHDKAVGEGFERTDVTLQSIHDAELELSRAQKSEEDARNELHAGKLLLREQTFQDNSETEDKMITKCHIKELDQVLLLDVGDVIQNSGKWPLLIDPSNQAITFLRYRDTNYINMLNPRHAQEEVIRSALLGSIRYGKFLVLDMMEVNMLDVVEDTFNRIQDNLYEELIDKSLIKDEAR